ncbi:hypothetical protein EAI_12576, partial [Harpegnathos saltator]
IILLSETWLQEEIRFSIRHFNIVRKDRLLRKGGGVAICLKKGIKFSEMEDLFDCDGKLEVVGIRLYLGEEEFYLISCYRPPGSGMISVNSWSRFF